MAIILYVGCYIVRMIEQHLINFSIVVVVQLLFFLVHAFSVKELKSVGRYLLLGALVGVPFGIAFDVTVGLYSGIFTYTIGFPFWFLIINGLLSYGFMVANVFLLHNHTVHHMFFWSALLGIVYEITNYAFPVWEWTFGTHVFEYGVVILAAYFGLAWMMMVILQILFGTQFKIVPFTFTLKAK
jgi:hypothetical protein